MAALPNKNINPVLAVVANLCCCGILGYILLGQARKGVFPLVAALAVGVVGGIVVMILGHILWILASLVDVAFVVVFVAFAVSVAIDCYKVAEAVQNGAEVDENEYKFELLYKIMSLIDKQAIYKG